MYTHPSSDAIKAFLRQCRGRAAGGTYWGSKRWDVSIYIWDRYLETEPSNLYHQASNVL